MQKRRGKNRMKYNYLKRIHIAHTLLSVRRIKFVFQVLIKDENF